MNTTNATKGAGSVNGIFMSGSVGVVSDTTREQILGNVDVSRYVLAAFDGGRNSKVLSLYQVPLRSRQSAR